LGVECDHLQARLIAVRLGVIPDFRFKITKPGLS
jgi:hypothetical protein